MLMKKYVLLRIETLKYVFFHRPISFKEYYLKKRNNNIVLFCIVLYFYEILFVFV